MTAVFIPLLEIPTLSLYILYIYYSSATNVSYAEPAGEDVFVELAFTNSEYHKNRYRSFIPTWAEVVVNFSETEARNLDAGYGLPDGFEDEFTEPRSFENSQPITDGIYAVKVPDAGTRNNKNTIIIKVVATIHDNM